MSLSARSRPARVARAPLPNRSAPPPHLSAPGPAATATSRSSCFGAAASMGSFFAAARTMLARPPRLSRAAARAAFLKGFARPNRPCATSASSRAAASSTHAAAPARGAFFECAGVRHVASTSSCARM